MTRNQTVMLYIIQMEYHCLVVFIGSPDIYTTYIIFTVTISYP
jgi:hypothetical protein